MTSELKQTLFKAGIGLAAFGFAATGYGLTGPLITAIVSCPREAQSLRKFFAVLRDRSEQEYVEITRDELGQQEVLNYSYDRAATMQ